MDNKANGSSTSINVPKLTAAEQQGLRDYWEIYEAHYQEISAELGRELAVHPELAPLIRNTNPEKAAEQQRVSLELQRRAILQGEWEPYLSNAETQGAFYAQAGISFKTWFEVVGGFRKHILPFLLSSYGQIPDRLLAAIQGMDRYIDMAMSVIGEGYLTTKENIIGQQQESIRELSTPVLQLRDRLLILPIIGVLDSHRARQVTEQLLNAIRAQRARVVVIDITGVPTVDSAVANHLLQTVEASRLMGATAIVTGLSAEIAQTLVRIGVNLSKLNTMGDLQGGIEEAEHLLGFRSVLAQDESPLNERGAGDSR